MKKGLKIALIAIAVLVVGLFVAYRVLISSTKKHSPEQFITATVDGVDIEIFYNSPSVKGRTIFGELVPYGEVWRTGANEPTTIRFSKDVLIEGNPLAAGKYSLWTMPDPDNWTVLFNAGEYPWGTTMDGKAAYDASLDKARVVAPVYHADERQEQLLIAVTDDPQGLMIAWDDVEIRMHLSAANN